MTTIIIPKNISKNKELIAVSKKEYEEFSMWQKTFKKYKTFIPTETQKKELKRAREDYKKGNYFTINELKQKLGVKNQA